MKTDNWVYWVAYKKLGPGVIKWISTTSQSVKISSEQAEQFAAKKGWLNEGYLYYGHSKTYTR